MVVCVLCVCTKTSVMEDHKKLRTWAIMDDGTDLGKIIENDGDMKKLLRWMKIFAWIELLGSVFILIFWLVGPKLLPVNIMAEETVFLRTTLAFISWTLFILSLPGFVLSVGVLHKTEKTSWTWLAALTFLTLAGIYVSSEQLKISEYFPSLALVTIALFQVWVVHSVQKYGQG